MNRQRFSLVWHPAFEDHGARFKHDGSVHNGMRRLVIVRTVDLDFVNIGTWESFVGGIKNLRVGGRCHKCEYFAVVLQFSSAEATIL